MFRYFTFKRLLQYIFLSLAHLPMSGRHRWILLKLGGVNFTSKKPHTQIHGSVVIDTVHPELITIGNWVGISHGSKIITHFLDPTQKGKHYRYGKVVIEDEVILGLNTIICNSVTIGKGAIIGAGSVVTKDIPPYEVWAGVPAKFIKKRAH